MEVMVKATTESRIDVEPEQAFKILCESLSMSFVCDESHDYYVSPAGAVWKTINGRDTEVDDRGDLFIALRNVAVNLFPNTIFRNAEYIYGRGEG